jgi:hypothetical protein
VELELHLKDRKDRLVVKCDRYEKKDVEEGDYVYRRLVLYLGDREIGQYNADSLIGYHELPERSAPLIV